MRLSDLLEVLESLAPLRHAERWDNVGLLVGDPARPVERALLCIDATEAVLAEALAARCELVVAYHPVIFEGLKRVTAPSVVFRAVAAGVAIWSPHTALDVAPGGTNDVLAEALGLTATRPLRPSAGAGAGAPAGEAGWGIGRVGALPDIPRTALIERVKRALRVDALLVAGPTDGVAAVGAVAAGAGRELLTDAIRARAEVFLTGELPHHDALRAAREGLTVLCALHSNSERRALGGLRERLATLAPTVAWSLSAADRDPYTVR